MSFASSPGWLSSNPPPPEIFVAQVRHPTGLWLPERTAAPRRSRPELLLPPSAEPQPDDMVSSAPTPEELDLPSATLDDVLDLISEVPFAPAMMAMSLLAADLYHHPTDRERHLLLGRELYGGRVWAAFERFVRAGPTRRGFDPRQVAALQRLLIEHAAPDPPHRRDLTPGEVARLAGALLGVASALPAGAPPARDPESPDDWAAWARYTTLIGAWHDEPEVAPAMARAHAWYIDVHGDPAFRERKARCDVDEWLEASYGLTFGEQLAGGLACAAVTKALDRDATPNERRLHIEPGFLRNGALTEKEGRLIELISSSRAEFVELMSDSANDPARIAWDHAVFEQRPFLRANDGTLRLISPRGLVSWMTRGMHHRALQVAQNRPHPRKADESMATIYLGYAGALGEEAVRRLVGRSHQTQERAGVVRVHGEHSYKIGKKRKDSPDLMLDFGEDIVLMEVFSGRISRDARTTLNADLLRKALDRATIVKLTELAARLRELLNGDLTYDGFDLGRVRRVWPVLVLAGDPIMQTPALWNYLHNEAPEAFINDARVKRPTIGDLDDLEPLLALVQEEGYLLPGLLADFMDSRYAQLPPRNRVHATFGGIKRRPLYIEEQAERAVRLAGTTLFPASRRLAEFRLDSREP